MSQALTPELKTEFIGLLADARKEFETIAKDEAKGQFDSLRGDTLKKMDSRLDELEAKFAKPLIVATPEILKSKSRDILNEFLRKASGASNAYRDDAPEEIKSMVASVDAQGGFLVTPDMSGRMIAKSYETSAVRAYASVQSITSDVLEGNIDNDEADSGWVSEQGTRAETNTPELGKYRIDVHEQYANAKISQKLLDDAGIDPAAWLENKIGAKLGRTENAAYIAANGIGKPRGFCSYTTVATADDARTWGQFEHVATATNGAFPASNPADKLLDVIGAMKPAYLNNSRWFTLRSVNTLMRKFKTSADAPYLWEPSLVAGSPNRLNGYEVVIFPDMPALATDSLSLAFGDLRQAYQIVDRLGIRMLRDPYTAKPFVMFYAIKRTGGGAVNFEALKFIKFGS